MDWNPDFRKIGMEGLVLLVNGPDEARARGAQAGQGRRRVGQDLSDRRRRRARHQRSSHALHDLRGDARRRRRRRTITGSRSPATAGRPRGSRTRCAPATTRSSTARSWTTRRSTCCSTRDVPVRAGAVLRAGQHRARAGVRHVAGGDRRPPGNARRRRGERPHDPARPAAGSAWAATTASPGTRTATTPRS